MVLVDPERDFAEAWEETSGRDSYAVSGDLSPRRSEWLLRSLASQAGVCARVRSAKAEAGLARFLKLYRSLNSSLDAGGKLVHGGSSVINNYDPSGEALGDARAKKYISTLDASLNVELV